MAKAKAAGKDKPKPNHHSEQNPGPIANSLNKLDQHAAPPPAVLSVTKELSLHRLDQATSALENMVPNILKLEAAAERAAVTDEVTFNKGSTFVSCVDRELEQLEALRSAIYKPVWDYAQLISATFQPYKARLTAIRSTVKELMTTWYKAEEVRKQAEANAARARAEEEARELAAKHEKAGNADVAQAVLDAALNAPAPVAKPIVTMTNAVGGRTSARKVWKGKVEDREALLRGILDGKIPWIVIDFKQKEIDTVARQAAAVGLFHGIKVTHETDLAQR